MKSSSGKSELITGSIFAVCGLILHLFLLSVANNKSGTGLHIAPGHKASELYLFSIPIITVGVILIILGIIKKRKEKEAIREAREIEEKRLEEEKRKRKSIKDGDEALALQFYRNCVSEGINNVQTESNIERLKLYIKRKSIEGTIDELIAAYKKGEKVAKIEDAGARIKQLLEKEEKIDHENRQYLNYSGRDKLIKILKDHIREEEAVIAGCEKQTDSIRNGGSSLIQKEHDWAVAGGIANGIAGPAAGVVTALDVQRRNAGIRQSNAEVANLMLDSMGQVNKNKIRARDNKEKWERLLKKAEACLVEDNDKRDYMNYLDISVEAKELSETGNAIVTIRIQQKRPLYIFGDVPAVVDGSIKVCLSSNGKTVGEGYYVFPFYGSGSRGGAYLKKIICKGNDIPQYFSASVIANNLWGLEKIDFFG